MDVEKMIEDNKGLVYKQLHRFNLAYDNDAISYAFETLHRAAVTYDKEKKVAFSTYASSCIYNSIIWYLREKARDEKLKVVSFEEPVDDCVGVTIADTLSTDETAETAYLSKELNEMIWLAFDRVYDALPNEVSKSIIRIWRDSDFTIRQRELADRAGTSQAHVSRTLSAFKHKFKKEMEDYLCEK